MDPGSTYSDMQREDANRQQTRRIIQRLTAYLSAHSVEVASDQDFIDHLETIAQDTRLTGDAMELSVRQAYSAQMNHMLILNLAEALVLVRTIKVRSSPWYSQVFQQHLRRKFIASLRSQDRWHEPWITIIDQELPGPPALPLPPLVAKARRRLTARLATRFNRHLNAVDEQLAVFLEIRGVNLYPRDRVTVTMLARELITSGLVSGRKADGQNILAASELIARTSSPEHPAWNQLLKTYFL